MVVVSRSILGILTFWNRRVIAMALWPLLIFKDQESRNNKVVFNHEKIHHRQQLELLILPYYIWYFLEYWYAMFKNGFRHHTSYMQVSFEKEAFANESKLDYLDTRPFLSSLNYFGKKENP